MDPVAQEEQTAEQVDNQQPTEEVDTQQVEETFEQPEAGDNEVETAQEEAEASAEDTGKRKLVDTEPEGEEPAAKREKVDTEEPAQMEPEINANGGATEAAAAPADANGDGPVTEVLDCPEKLVGKLIGKKGETIQWLESETQCKIQVDHKTPGDPKKVTVTAQTREAFDNAAKLIHDVIHSEGPMSETAIMIPCPQGIVGRIIGRAGETIRQLQQASQAKILVKQEGFPEGAPREIHITGRPEAIDRAKKMVTELINGEAGSIQAIIQKYCAGATKTMEVQKNMVGRIIGKGGETIKQLQKDSGTNIQIDQSVQPCKVTITGPDHAVAKAMQMVNAVMQGNGPGMGAPGAPFGGFPGVPGGYSQPAYGGYGGYPPGGEAQQPYGYYGGNSYPQPGYTPPAAQAGGYGGGYGGGYSQPEPYGAAQFGGGASGYGGHGAPAQHAAPAQSAWQECYDERTGQTYYWNSKTSQSQWEKPAEMM